MTKKIVLGPSLVFLLAVTLLVASCRETPPAAAAPISLPQLPTQYSAVFLMNGQAYFGKLENFGSPYPVLTEVYYVQTQVNQETKEVKNTLIKRGNEWHGPDRMVLNAEHILFVEPVSDGSQVAKLIQELKGQRQP